MPIYEYECKKCGKRVEALIRSEKDVPAKCTKCGGGLNKAVVKDFPGITPDDRGNIVIRITTTPDSPDKNAKISGLEILKAGAGQ